MLRITLRQCLYFTAVAEAGAMARAARQLNVSEPAVADAVSKLEGMTGLQLFERHHARGVSLTRQGQSFHHAVKGLLRTAGDVELLAAELVRETAGDLRLGCFQTIAPFILPGLLCAMAKQFPRARLLVEEDHHHRLVGGLADGSFDLAILYRMSALPDEVAFRSLVKLQPYVVMPADHRLGPCRELSLGDLEEEDLVLFDLPGSADYFEQLFDRAGLMPRVAFRSQSSESVRSVVASGLGVSVLVMRPPVDLSYDGKPVALVPLDRSVAPLEMIVAWRKDAPTTPLRDHMIETVAGLVRAHAGEFGLRPGEPEE